jgi:1,4-dihydroxy-2-naphthoate octaprenyltransferase
VLSIVTLSKLKSWLRLSRPMFHIVGVLPFFLGAILAWHDTNMFRVDVFLLGSLGAVLIMLAAYFAGEYWDIEEDRISSALLRSRFSGGSGVVVSGLVARRTVLYGVYGSLAVAGVVGFLLVVVYHTGPWTIPLGVVGMIGGFYYSSRPVRWVSTGLGEIWIAFCYGWLPVNTGYYLQAGAFSPLATWISIPVALTIFNVILINEFPDYPADQATGKNNLAVRLGLPAAAILYGVIAAGSWIFLFLSPITGVPWIFLLFMLPFQLLSLLLVLMMMRGRWQELAFLERLCGGTILVNIGISAAYVISFLVR